VKILLTGAAGMLGRDLGPVLIASGHQVTGVDIAEFDITEQASVEAYFKECDADCCVHAAAYTNVDGCETNESLAHSVNAEGTGNLARACAAGGKPLYYVSTEYVFPGDGDKPCLEDDATGPLSVYGRTKLAGERVVRESGEDWCVLRTCGVYGKHGKNFVDTILTRGAAGQPLRVVADQVVSPTWTIEFSRALVAILEQSARGVYHLAPTGSCNWYELALAALEIAGIDKVEVTPIASDELEQAAPRPGFSALDNGKLRRELGYTMAGWREALTEYVDSK
jgi:dTDP-4-dehydrorhamnose reductase